MAEREMVSRVRAFVHLVRSAESLHTKVSRHLAEDGITASQFSTLKALRFHGPLAQREIATHILKSGGNITMVVDNLEKAGLAIRERDQQDRRMVYVSLTKQGEELFDRIYPHHLQCIREAMSELTEDECETLVDLIQRVDFQDIIVYADGKGPRDH